jgi:hypothetical protein
LCAIALKQFVEFDDGNFKVRWSIVWESLEGVTLSALPEKLVLSKMEIPWGQEALLHNPPTAIKRGAFKLPYPC